MNIQIESSWKAVLKEEFENPYFLKLMNTIHNAYKEQAPVYPPQKLIFNAFSLCPFQQVKIVILGQDPYHRPNQANGLCFSVNQGTRIPPSLKNIYTELENDLGTKISATGDLTFWATQGVLLLNSTLTVEGDKPGSHQKLGWEKFTNVVIKKISDNKEHLVVFLWGKYAQSKRKLIDETKHLVLVAPHPSPLSAYTGFFGCKHFSKANEYLVTHGKLPVRWYPPYPVHSKK